jgi:hypothetical protein
LVRLRKKSMTEKQKPNLTIIHTKSVATDLHKTQTHAKQQKRITRHKILTMIANVTKPIAPDTTSPTVPVAKVLLKIGTIHSERAFLPMNSLPFETKGNPRPSMESEIEGK